VKRFSELVEDRRETGVYILAGNAGRDEVRRVTEAHDLSFFLFSAKDVHNKDALLQAAGSACHFPDYFGHNWDAFEECITDMSWQPSPGYVILIEAIASLRTESPTDFENFLAVLQDAASSWAGQGKSFFVLIHDSAYRNEELETIEL
jgi:RNAse (barnase) inhibitor barstar